MKKNAFFNTIIIDYMKLIFKNAGTIIQRISYIQIDKRMWVCYAGVGGSFLKEKKLMKRIKVQ